MCIIESLCYISESNNIVNQLCSKYKSFFSKVVIVISNTSHFFLWEKERRERMNKEGRQAKDPGTLPAPTMW